MKDKYSINVFWSEEDDCFIATSHEFPLLSAHGETREEAAGEIQIILEMAIESYLEDNIELPTPKTSNSYSGQFRVRMPRSTHKDLVETAELEGVSLNTYVISLLTENHTFKKAHAQEIDALKDIISKLSCGITTQHEELQVHTQKLNFHKAHVLHQDIEQQTWPTSFGIASPLVFKRSIENEH